MLAGDRQAGPLRRCRVALPARTKRRKRPGKASDRQPGRRVTADDGVDDPRRHKGQRRELVDVPLRLAFPPGDLLERINAPFELVKAVMELHVRSRRSLSPRVRVPGLPLA